MDEILEKHRKVFDKINYYSKKQEKWEITSFEADALLKDELKKSMTNILKEEAERKGISYDEWEFIKVRDELVENTLKLKDVVILSRKLKDVKTVIEIQFGTSYKEILWDRIVEVLKQYGLPSKEK